MQEKELKIKLESKDDYLIVRDNLAGFQKEVEQTNMYFDTANQELLQQGIMVRLRHAGKRYIVTVKGKASAKDGYFTANEWEKEIPESIAAPIDSGSKFPSEILQDLPEYFQTAIDTSRLTMVGRTCNVRRIYHVGEFTVELDLFNVDPQTQDYEIEIETDDPEGARRFLQDFLAKYKVHHSDQLLTKYKRFLQGKGQNNT